MIVLDLEKIDRWINGEGEEGEINGGRIRKGGNIWGRGREGSKEREEEGYY